MATPLTIFLWCVVRTFASAVRSCRTPALTAVSPQSLWVISAPSVFLCVKSVAEIFLSALRGNAMPTVARVLAKIATTKISSVFSPWEFLLFMRDAEPRCGQLLNNFLALLADDCYIMPNKLKGGFQCL